MTQDPCAVDFSAAEYLVQIKFVLLIDFPHFFLFSSPLPCIVGQPEPVAVVGEEEGSNFNPTQLSKLLTWRQADWKTTLIGKKM